MVTILSRAGLGLGDRRIQRRGLAAAGGPGDEQHAVGQASSSAAAASPRACRSPAHRAAGHEGARSAPACRGRAAPHPRRRCWESPTRESRSGRRSSAMLKRPSCGTRRSAMSSSDITLMREMTCSATRHAADRGDVHQHAVDAVTNGQAVGGRLQMNVAGAGAQRIVDGRMHQPHDRAGIFADRHIRKIVGTRAGSCPALSACDNTESMARSASARRAMKFDEFVSRRRPPIRAPRRCASRASCAAPCRKDRRPPPADRSACAPPRSSGASLPTAAECRRPARAPTSSSPPTNR